MASRWMCTECDREWLPGIYAMGAEQWAPERGCPGCGSLEVTEMEFRPLFPGLDIPRETLSRQSAKILQPKQWEVSEPPAVLAKDDVVEYSDLGFLLI